MDTLAADLRINGTICTSDEAKIAQLVTSGQPITIAALQAICPSAVVKGVNSLSIHVNGVPQVPNSGSGAGVAGDSKSSDMNGSTWRIIWAKNETGDPGIDEQDQFCTSVGSPLVVHMASVVSRPQPIALSSQADGIDFDLLGLRNFFRAVRISWFTNHEYRMLALPDASGQIRGIDQLFGDNTQGPDGAFADHGYGALAKYDGTLIDGLTRVAAADGRIDRNDPIYNELRLWLDKDFDGVSDPGELTTLAENGLEFIDLRFSEDFHETDMYGNETQMKSVVGFRDGTLDLIFDLWFAYKGGGL
jgi:hypothetical protein